ncbi:MULTISPECIES: uroporphyrinogen-III synthase [Methylosinus]|uniref:Uroporphyrinogen-III synthase n=1 Tax=Methylosinus trichosporium (strain ATCC 35070 / NCIMB 11131 / UNIQEM 75 / OB3b) TaxID=595536 RepID=A0A2D2CXX1_METT3|nr:MULTISPECIES: uroporphyrinogen-III synthase [Methylosinus]ATQ67578.1 uroporphyrinogen III synthase HEM4 [Methylosinus trichosporium OB3b]OBS52121.1 uroporphyrinogen III synthase HEM4 [Methylosinus sp. 3S-1]
MSRVLVTRARDDAERTAEKLRRLGHEPILAPVTEIVATGAAIPRESFDAVLATSARALRHAGEDVETLRDVPLYVVGARTAEAARARGLHVEASASDVAGLIALLRERFPTPRRFLYLAGRDRKDALEEFLRSCGHETRVVEIYHAQETAALPADALAAMACGEIDVVLHYSARSAALFLALTQGRVEARRIEAVAHLALSADVARVLRGAGCTHVRVASSPNEDSLLQSSRAPPVVSRRAPGPE